jgi:hypothetical protein
MQLLYSLYQKENDSRRITPKICSSSGELSRSSSAVTCKALHPEQEPCNPMRGLIRQLERKAPRNLSSNLSNMILSTWLILMQTTILRYSHTEGTRLRCLVISWFTCIFRTTTFHLPSSIGRPSPFTICNKQDNNRELPYKLTTTLM